MEERTSGFKPVKKKRGRFNLMDLILVLLAIGIALFVLFVIDPFSINLLGADEQNVTLEYSIRIENVEATFMDKIRIRDEVTDASLKSSLGFVNAVENDIPHTEPYYDSEADLVSMKEYPNRYDLIITITTDAMFTQGVGYTVNGRRIAVGSEFYLMFPEYIGEGFCVSMREIG